MRRAPTAEEELLLLLCGTDGRRRRAKARLGTLAGCADLEVLAALMAHQLLLPLLGTRLVEATPAQVTPAFRDRVERALAPARKRGAQLEMLALQLQADLEAARLEALPLKGTSLARNLYGDPGLRPAHDIDLLVKREDIPAAIEVLGRRGYRRATGSEDGARLHVSLRHERAELPAVEVHWRIHWYEESFSREMLRRSEAAPEGRRALPADELAALLLYFSRDGLTGLRLATDIATWWDTQRDPEDGPRLDRIASEAPELRQGLCAAAAVAERLVGVPADAILPARTRGWRTRTAVRLANWTVSGDADQIGANITLVDWLLSPRGDGRSFARRTLVPSREQISAMYDLPATAGWRRAFWRAAHCPKLLARYLIALWRVRGGRPWVAIPASAGIVGGEAD